MNFCQTLYIYLAFDTTTYVASAWQPVASAWQPVTHLRHKDKSHCEETGEEDRHGNEGKTSVLVGANDECDWSGDETQHLQQQQQQHIFRQPLSLGSSHNFKSQKRNTFHIKIITHSLIPSDRCTPGFTHVKQSAKKQVFSRECAKYTYRTQSLLVLSRILIIFLSTRWLHFSILSRIFSLEVLYNHETFVTPPIQIFDTHNCPGIICKSCRFYFYLFEC